MESINLGVLVVLQHVGLGQETKSTTPIFVVVVHKLIVIKS